jgi:hypothetical protein
MLVIYPLNRVGAFTKFGTKTIINFSTGVLIEVALPGSPTVSVISYYSASNWKSICARWICPLLSLPNTTDAAIEHNLKCQKIRSVERCLLS